MVVVVVLDSVRLVILGSGGYSITNRRVAQAVLELVVEIAPAMVAVEMVVY